MCRFLSATEPLTTGLFRGTKQTSTPMCLGHPVETYTRCVSFVFHHIKASNVSWAPCGDLHSRKREWCAARIHRPFGRRFHVRFMCVSCAFWKKTYTQKEKRLTCCLRVSFVILLCFICVSFVFHLYHVRSLPDCQDPGSYFTYWSVQISKIHSGGLKDIKSGGSDFISFNPPEWSYATMLSNKYSTVMGGSDFISFNPPEWIFNICTDQ